MTAAPLHPSSGTALAYRLEHPKYGIELSIYQPDGDWAARGWTVTPLYAGVAQRPVDRGVSDTFTPGEPVEVRLQNGEIDEIVIRRGDVHIEQMSADGWFLGVNASDGSYHQFWFGAKNRKSHVHFRHTETVSSTPRECTFPACGCPGAPLDPVCAVTSTDGKSL